MKNNRFRFLFSENGFYTKVKVCSRLYYLLMPGWYNCLSHTFLKNINTLRNENCLVQNSNTGLALKEKLSSIMHNACSYHHHHVALVARISLTLSRHSSLSFIAIGRSSGQHPVFSHSYWMYVGAGRPAFARPCVGVHKSTSLMSSSLLLQQCPACLVRLTWIVFVIGGRWP